MASLYKDPEFEQMIRSIAPSDAYGSAGFILSPDFGIGIIPLGQSVSITGDFSDDSYMQTGFNCLDVSELIVRKAAEEHGANLRIVSAEDELGIWFRDKKHYCCLDRANRIIDGTPIFRFFGAEHDIDDEDGIEARIEKGQRSINPIKAKKGIGVTYVVTVDFIDVENPQDYIDFRVCDQRIDSFGKNHISFLTYHLDVRKFKACFNEKLKGTQNTVITFNELVQEAILSSEASHPKQLDFGKILPEYPLFVSALAKKLAYAAIDRI